jgi:TonB family protein
MRRFIGYVIAPMVVLLTVTGRTLAQRAATPPPNSLKSIPAGAVCMRPGSGGPRWSFPINRMPDGMGHGIVCPDLVDYPARVHVKVLPQYPQAMLASNVHGEVLLQFVFDSTGHADTLGVRILGATNADFANATVAAVAEWSGEPALLGAHALGQWVMIDVRFFGNCSGHPNPPIVSSSAFLCIEPPRKR